MSPCQSCSCDLCPERERAITPAKLALYAERTCPTRDCGLFRKISNLKKITRLRIKNMWLLVQIPSQLGGTLGIRWIFFFLSLNCPHEKKNCWVTGHNGQHSLMRAVKVSLCGVLNHPPVQPRPLSKPIVHQKHFLRGGG